MKFKVTILIVLSCLLSMGSMAFAQNAPIDFETAGNGASWTWTTFENDSNPPLGIVANPNASGANTSATVASMTTLITGQAWAGVETLHGADIGTYAIDVTNSTIKIMVYKSVLSDVGIKLVKPDGWSMGEIKVANTVINAWEELTFDFSGQMESGYDQIVIFPDFDLAGRTTDNLSYFDNISFSGEELPPGPATQAPAPTAAVEEVISVFSDTYTNIAGTNLNPGWGQATVVSEVPIEGNNTLLYAGLDYQGIELGSSQNLSEFDVLHVDFWSANTTALSVFLISNGPVEVEYALTVSTESWVSADVPLTAFSPVDLADVIQLKFVGDGDVYLDNIYFSAGGTAPTAPTVSAPAPTQVADDVMSIYSEAYTDLAETNFNPAWGQSTVVTVDADVAGTSTLMYESLNYQGTNLGGADGVGQDVSGYDFLHVDFWTANAPALNFFLISTTTGEQAYALPITAGQWVSVDIPLTYFTDLGLGLTDIFQFKVDGGDGASTVWFDNWYFYSVAPVEPLDIAGTWIVAPEAAALMVGPNPNDGSWWSSSADDVTTRACFFDDQFVFNADGSFANVMDGETWLETWQGVDADGCGTPIAPHDGSNAATYSSDAGSGTITLNGVGAYLGIPKAYTGGELTTPADAPASITYEVTLSDDDEAMTLVISTGGGYWTFKLVDINSSSNVVENVVPDDFALRQNYPNPFNPSTTIEYSIVQSGHVTLKVFNITGQEVVTLVDGIANPGTYTTSFNANHLAAGTYFYSLTAGNQNTVKKMVLIK